MTHIHSMKSDCESPLKSIPLILNKGSLETGMKNFLEKYSLYECSTQMKVLLD